ncbi:MAG: hypothetical protein IJ580_00060 [Prevotella sp.]|nr:hypothetical protein [Prevotella sp.]
MENSCIFALELLSTEGNNMNAVSLENLWSYLQGLSLTASNQRWLGERLIEAADNRKASGAATFAHHQTRKHKRALSDAELTEKLAQFAPLTDADFPEISAEEYTSFAKKHSGCITKGLEKWL